jgi:hypothetical protein
LALVCAPPLPQVTEEEEEKGNAGDPIEGDDAIVQTKATAKELADAAAAKVNAEAAVAQANATTKRAQTQATQVQEQTKPEVSLELGAKEVQPEVQLESTPKEVMPAVTADMAALMVMMQSMQQDNATRMSALQTQLQAQLTDQQRLSGLKI